MGEKCKLTYCDNICIVLRGKLKVRQYLYIDSRSVKWQPLL